MMSTYSLELATLRITNQPLIGCRDRILVIGTCFADGFSNRILSLGIQSSSIPFGNPIFSPASLSIFLDFCQDINKDLRQYTLHDEENQGIRFLPFGIAGGIADNEEQLLTMLHADIDAYTNEIRNSDIVMLFLGTSRIIKTVNNSIVINRVNGIPEINWESEQMSSEDIAKSLDNSIECIRKINKKAKIIIGIDPQRYLFAFLDDPVSDNCISKAYLLQGIIEATKRHKHVYYFKSLETVYEELHHAEYINAGDLTHVNSLTIDHLFQRFIDSFFDDKLRKGSDSWYTIYKSYKSFRYFHNLSNLGQAQKKILGDVLDSLLDDGISFILTPEIYLTSIKNMARRCGYDKLLAKINGNYIERHGLSVGERFFVWGTGGRMENTIGPCLVDNDNFLGFIDNDAAKQNKVLLGKPIHSPEVLSKVKPDAIIIVSTYYEDIKDQIKRNWPEIKISYIDTHLSYHGLDSA